MSSGIDSLFKFQAPEQQPLQQPAAVQRAQAAQLTFQVPSQEDEPADDPGVRESDRPSTELQHIIAEQRRGAEVDEESTIEPIQEVQSEDDTHLPSQEMTSHHQRVGQPGSAVTSNPQRPASEQAERAETIIEASVNSSNQASGRPIARYNDVIGLATAHGRNIPSMDSHSLISGTISLNPSINPDVSMITDPGSSVSQTGGPTNRSVPQLQHQPSQQETSHVNPSIPSRQPQYWSEDSSRRVDNQSSVQNPSRTNKPSELLDHVNWKNPFDQQPSLSNEGQDTDSEDEETPLKKIS